jgi:hypothetical protein
MPAIEGEGVPRWITYNGVGLCDCEVIAGSHQHVPTDVLFGGSSEPVQCREFAPDVSVHWFASLASKTCMCGKAQQRA